MAESLVRSSARNAKRESRTDTEIRRMILQYLYDRNHSATSMCGKSTGASVTIMTLRGELKRLHGLAAQEVISNLNYLLSQGWAEERPVARSFTTSRGGVVPSVTNHFKISALGIDKIEGPGEFTMDQFHGIKIEATGRNVITVGNGNHVSVEFRDLGEALVRLENEIKTSTLIGEAEKMEAVADIAAIQTQLVKAQPNKPVVQILWQGVERIAQVAGATDAATNVWQKLAEWVS